MVVNLNYFFLQNFYLYYTTLLPSYRGECSDNYDCKNGQTCIQQYDVDGQIKGICITTKKKPDKKPSKNGKWEIVKPRVVWNINLQAFENGFQKILKYYCINKYNYYYNYK